MSLQSEVKASQQKWILSEARLKAYVHVCHFLCLLSPWINFNVPSLRLIPTILILTIFRACGTFTLENNSPDIHALLPYVLLRHCWTPVPRNAVCGGMEEFYTAGEIFRKWQMCYSSDSSSKSLNKHFLQAVSATHSLTITSTSTECHEEWMGGI